MKIRVVISMGWQDLSFYFDNEEAASLFAGTARKHLIVEKDDEGKDRRSKVIIEFSLNEEEEK